jgi:hypothetical protein
VLEHKLMSRGAWLGVALLSIVLACPAFPAACQTAPPPQGSPGGDNAASAPPTSPATPAPAPDTGKPNKAKKDKGDSPAEIASWLVIEVVGGTDKTPVPEASVYVRFTEVHKVGKDKKFEFDLKTNQEGVARAPDIPQGKVEIQIVAPGWASFGQYYDVEQDQQTIHIELQRPPRWY